MSEGVTRLVAELCGIKDDLGEKGKHPSVNGHTRGILAGSEPSHHFPFHPKHASWINQIEIWFSILVRKLPSDAVISFQKTTSKGSKASSLTSMWRSRSAGP
jgi:DDE superfamily endonuclease